MGLDICVQRIVKKPKDKESFIRLNEKYVFPDWTKEFEQDKTEEMYDWEKYKEQTGIDIEQMDWYSTSYDEDGSIMYVYPKDNELPVWSSDYPGGVDAYEKDINNVIIKIDLDKVPTKSVVNKVIYWKEVGYQRKGLNNKFYDDYEEGKIDYFVWTKDELLRYKEDYCTESCDKEKFQRNIIDNFEEGKDCVIFDW